MATNKVFPELRKVGEKEAAKLRKLFKALDSRPGFIRAGPSGYLFSALFQSELEDIYNLEVKPTDIYVNTFPRSGTTWTQEMVWLILNDLDYAKAASINLIDRYVQVGSPKRFIETNEVDEEGNKKFVGEIGLSSELLAGVRDPRFIKSHMPLSLLPPNLINTAKVVYVARDPRDVVVSLYHLCRSMKMAEYTGDFKSFWNMFVNDNMLRTPYFAHVKEAWDLRNHPNMLFLFYEDLKMDLSGVIKRTAKFFNKEYTDAEIQKLCNHLHIENFRKNKSVNFLVDVSNLVPGEQPFIRKGIVGGWRDYFDEEMTKEVEIWMAKNLKETGIRYPVFKESANQ